MYEEDFDLDVYVIVFEWVLRLNGEIEEEEIINLFCMILKKGF